MSRETVILITLCVYMALLLVIGLLAQRRTKDGDDFFLGGRRLGPLVAAVGASASSSSAWTLLGVSGAAWAWGLSALWLLPACVGGFVLNWYVLAPALQRFSHRTGTKTIADVLTHGARGRWRRAVLLLAAFIILISLGAYVASQFQGAGKVFGTIFGIDMWVAVVIGAVVILLYTMLGGMWAVGITDTVQGLMMAATAIVLPTAALIEVGGLAALGDAMKDVPVDGFGRLGGPRTGILAIGFVLGLLGIGLGYPGQPHVLKYFMALRDEKGSVVHARRIAVTWALVIYTGMILLGLCGRALVPAIDDKEKIFVQLTTDLFNPVVGGIMLAAVLSAIMSTADSQLLVASSTVVHDVGLTGKTPRDTLRRSRVVVLLLTAAAAVAALTGSKEIFSRVLFGWAAMGAAFGPLLLVRVVFKRRVRPAWVFGAMLTGFLVSVCSYTFYEDIFGNKDYELFTRNVVSWCAAFALAWLGSRRSKRDARSD